MLKRFKSLDRHAWLVIGLLVAITLLFFWRITFSGMILARGDVYSYFYPLWDARSMAFRAGQVPLWSPDVFMGAPLLANSQLGTFYPPNWLVTPFDAPTAITLSMLAHTFWALLGVYLLTRRTLLLDRTPALLAGVVFGLGGYLGGQSEHINQLQALSWMPWLFLVVSSTPTVGRWGVSLNRVLVFGVCVALQLLAGHPQTVFITLVGLGVFGLACAVGRPSSSTRRRWLPIDTRYIVRLGLVVALGALVGFVLAAPQLIPTLELSRLGNRGGGLDPQKVLAFSFTPLLMGRGLLPSYDGLLFGEYIAYSGVVGLGLALIGLFSRHPKADGNPSTSRSRWPFLLLIIIGFLFALGAYNPLNWLLASLPGFSFFRVPARWMALEALGAAALAGVGLQSLKQARPRLWVLALVVAVTVALALASTLAGRQAVDVIGPAVPTIRSWVGWGVALLALLLLVVARRWLGAKRVIGLLAVVAVLELFLASQIMPINLTTPKDVYSASRFTIRQLQVYGAEQLPSGRLLSISPLEFDPGDKDALNARYAALGMDALATRIALVATKLREVVGPNLGIRWGIPSIDGFDGGLLPNRFYTAFSTLLLPVGSDPSTDGRLREMLALPQCSGACIPDQRWLNLTNTRYLITDKTADVVQDGVFYDTSFELTRAKGQTITLQDFPLFEADALDLLCRDAGGCFVSVTFTYADGSTETLTGSKEFTVQTYNALRVKPTTPRVPVSILINPMHSIQLKAVTLVDTRTGLFQQMALPPFKRLLSSDIKLYENTAVQPRAFVVHDFHAVDEDAGTALTWMRDPAFDPTQVATIAGAPQTDLAAGSSSATITTYTPERVEVQANSESAAYLVLTDAYYPGWVATVNGSPAPILRADLMFRAVEIPAGASSIVFEYRPWWWPVVPLAGVVVWVGVGFALWWRRERT